VDQVVEHFKKERARHFDPRMTDILLENLDEFLSIRAAYTD
jgi:response regulator RpfG family c-di-GMP phosphodiesterase